MDNWKKERSYSRNKTVNCENVPWCHIWIKGSFYLLQFCVYQNFEFVLNMNMFLYEKLILVLVLILERTLYKQSDRFKSTIKMSKSILLFKLGVFEGWDDSGMFEVNCKEVLNSFTASILWRPCYLIILLITSKK